jgi:hypothetical protein
MIDGGATIIYPAAVDLQAAVLAPRQMNANPS